MEKMSVFTFFHFDQWFGIRIDGDGDFYADPNPDNADTINPLGIEMAETWLNKHPIYKVYSRYSIIPYMNKKW